MEKSEDLPNNTQCTLSGIEARRGIGQAIVQFPSTVSFAFVCQCKTMFALCVISLISVFGGIEPKKDTFLLQHKPMAVQSPLFFQRTGGLDPILISPSAASLNPLDTVYIHAQRLDFATLGRVVRTIQIGDDNKSLTDALDDQGVFFKQYGMTGSSTISRRGADANQTQVNWNGIPVNNVMLGMTDFNTLLTWGNTDLFLVDGGNSPTVGSGSMGGTIFMRNSAQFGAQNKFTSRGKILLSKGSFGERNFGAELGVSNNRCFLAVTAGRFDRSNTFSFADKGLDIPLRRMENARSEQGLIRGVLGYRKGKHYLKGVSEWVSMQRQLGLALGSFQPLGKQEDGNFRSVVEYIYQPNQYWSATHRMGYIQDEIEYFETPKLVIGSKSLAKTLHFQSEIYKQWGNWNGFLGTDIQYQKANSEYYLGWANRTLPASLLGINWANESLSAVFNARYEWHEKVPTAGLSICYKTSKWISIKANAHNSFRRPNLNDLFWITGNMTRELKPEKGWGVEGGLDMRRIFTKRWSISTEATVYYRTLDQPILWVPNGSFWYPVNLEGGGKYAGIQWAASSRWKFGTHALAFKSNWDRVSSRVRQTTNSDAYQQIFVPNWNGNFWVALEAKRWNIGTNLQYVGKRFIQTDNQAFLPSYKLINIQFQIPDVVNYLGYGWSINLEALNVFNTVFINMPGRPMPGRMLKLGLLFKWK